MSHIFKLKNELEFMDFHKENLRLRRTVFFFKKVYPTECHLNLKQMNRIFNTKSKTIDSILNSRISNYPPEFVCIDLIFNFNTYSYGGGAKEEIRYFTIITCKCPSWTFNTTYA